MPRPGHQGVVAQLHPGRAGQPGGEPRVRQVGHLVRHPPQAPHVTRRIEGGRAVAAQVGGQRPGDHHSGGDIADQQRELADAMTARGGLAGTLARGGRTAASSARGPVARIAVRAGALGSHSLPVWMARGSPPRVSLARPALIANPHAGRRGGCGNRPRGHACGRDQRSAYRRESRCRGQVSQLA